MRLLVCRECRTIEELPDYEGPAQNDRVLGFFVDEHQMGHPHGDHAANLLRVDDPTLIQAWHDPLQRYEVLHQIEWQTGVKLKNEDLGLGGEYYATRSTYVEDAAKCYAAHRRPQDGCIDWKSDSKLLEHPTREGQAWSSENYKLNKKMPHLCDFCVVKSGVQEKVFHQAGLYK